MLPRHRPVQYQIGDRDPARAGRKFDDPLRCRLLVLLVAHAEAAQRRDGLIVLGLGSVDDAEAGQDGGNPARPAEVHGGQEATHEGFKRFAELPDARSSGGMDVGEDAQHAASLGGVPVARVDVPRLGAVARKRSIGDPFAVQRPLVAGEQLGDHILGPLAVTRHDRLEIRTRRVFDLGPHHLAAHLRVMVLLDAAARRIEDDRRAAVFDVGRAGQDLRRVRDQRSLSLGQLEAAYGQVDDPAPFQRLDGRAPHLRRRSIGAGLDRQHFTVPPSSHTEICSLFTMTCPVLDLFGSVNNLPAK